jgi:signal transduction histidine kinase
MTAHAAGTEAGPGTAISALIRERLPDLARAWPEELAADGRFAPSVPLPEAERFVEAVASAAGGRLEPLAALTGVDAAERGGMAGRLDVVLSALDALRRCVVGLDRGGNGAHPDPSATAAVFAAVGRGLAARALAEVIEPEAGAPAPSAPVDPFGTTPMGVTLHELRRPLTIVSSYGQLLSAGTLGELPDRAATAVNALCGATETMLRLVQALSAVNRLEDPAERITVRDHGPGFPVADADRLFDKYFRSVAERDRGIAGTGLGLFIVRTIADRHRGEVMARLPEDGGAEFELALPLA